MIIGTNKETKNREYRVALLPEGARELVSQGHTVLVEKGAGAGAGWADDEYRAAGATMVQGGAAVWEAADMMYKVKEPMTWEYDLMRPGQVLYTYIHSAGNRPLCDKLLARGVLGIAFEDVLTDDGRLPLLEPMSWIAGYMGMFKGFELLQTLNGGPGLLPGGLAGARPAGVLILGCGLVGAGAVRVAAGLGAAVTALDIDEAKLEAIREAHPEVATLLSSPENIAAALPGTDILLNAVMWPKTRTGHLVTREMLSLMPAGAVLVDVAADIRGALETCERQTTHDDPVYTVAGHPHYVVANIPSLAARSASEALARVTLPYALKLAAEGAGAALLEDRPLRHGLTCIDGHMVRQVTAEWYGCAALPEQDVLALLRRI